MTSFVLVHGAFRGGWCWDAVRRILEEAGAATSAPTLDRRPDVTLADWVREIQERVAAAERPVVLVGHSQGGFVARVVDDRMGGGLAAVAYLDAAVPESGERACDLLPGAVPSTRVPPPPGTLVPPPAGGDERLVAEPAGPAFAPVALGPSATPSHYAFCTGTPPTYPCATTRARLDRAGVAYTLIDSDHDAPLTAPAAVSDWLLAVAATIA